METKVDFDYAVVGSMVVTEAKTNKAIEFLNNTFDFEPWQQIVQNQFVVDSRYFQHIVGIIQDSGLTIMEEK